MGGRAVQSPMAPFDFDAIFGENYLHFYLPMLDEDRNRAEAEEIIETLGLRPGDRVLDAPCGHGRISNLLAARGVVVVGVDASGLFLEKARTGAANAGVTVDYRAGHLRELPLGPNEDCDAVLNWFTSFGYFDDDGNKQVLREFHRALRPGGRLLLETIHRDAFVRVFTPAPFAYMTTAGPDGGDLQADRSTFELETGVLQTERTVVRDGKVSRSFLSVRLPALTELRQWLHDAGFGRVSFQSRHGQPVSLDTRRLVVLAEA